MSWALLVVFVITTITPPLHGEMTIGGFETETACQMFGENLLGGTRISVIATGCARRDP
jgi:hypothetical protein